MRDLDRACEQTLQLLQTTRGNTSKPHNRWGGRGGDKVWVYTLHSVHTLALTEPGRNLHCPKVIASTNEVLPLKGASTVECTCCSQVSKPCITPVILMSKQGAHFWGKKNKTKHTHYLVICFMHGLRSEWRWDPERDEKIWVKGGELRGRMCAQWAEMKTKTQKDHLIVSISNEVKNTTLFTIFGMSEQNDREIYFLF